MTPPMVYTRFLQWFENCAAATGIYTVGALVYNILRKKENRHAEHVLILAGVLVYIALSILNIKIFHYSMQSLAFGLSEISMTVMIFINMIALVLGFFRTETELDKALKAERENAGDQPSPGQDEPAENRFYGEHFT